MTPAASVIEGSQRSSSWVTPPLVCEGSPASGVLAGDSSSEYQGESASASRMGVIGDSTSVSSRSESVGDSSSLEWGRGHGDIVEHLHLGSSMQLA